jgi:inositol 1,4,5-triphosphate receptor type 1
LQNEFKYNVDTFENNKNIPLSFSQPFQLMHLNSSKFLACNFSESRYEKENYEIALEEYSSDSTLFKIVPAFKYQKDSSAVRI